MKKYLGLFLFTVLVLSFSVISTVNAEENNNLKESRGAFKSQIEARREAFKQRIETERTAFKETLQKAKDSFLVELQKRKEEFKLANKEQKDEFKKNVDKMISERFEVAVRNLERAQSRVKEVIDQLSKDGENTDPAIEYLNLSKDKLDQAEDKISDIEKLIPISGEGVTPEVFSNIKLLAREAKDLLKESKSSLMDSVKSIATLMGDSEVDQDDEADGDNE